MEPGMGEGWATQTELASLTRRVGELEREVAALRARDGVVEQRVETAAAVPPPPLPMVSDLAGSATVVSAAPQRAGAPAFEAAKRPEPVARAGVARERDLETRLGSEVFHRVGIVAILIAAAWFLKLAIARGWLGPTGRVLVGLVAGVGLVLWSEQFRRKGFAVFSYGLKALGSAVLYLTLWAAFQLYHLVPGPVALGAMVLVTAWNGVLAWAQDAELLGGYALAGAVATPRLLATGGDHEVFLFTYLLAADLLCVLLVRLKGWVRLLPWVFLSTVVYFAGWFGQFYTGAALLPTALFALLFFAVFQVPVFVTDSVAEDGAAVGGRLAGVWTQLRTVLLPLANAAFLALALSAVLKNAGHHAWLPWLMVGLAALYLALMRLPQRAVTAGVHLALAVVFLTIAIPLKATGEWITIAWLVEGVALLWVALRQANEADGQGRLLRVLACAALALGWVGAIVRVVGWRYELQAFWNARFGTAVAGLLAMAGAVLLSRGARRALAAVEKGRGDEGVMPSPAVADPERWPETWGIAAAGVIAFNVLAIAAFVREIVTIWQGALATDPEAGFKRALGVSGFLLLYGALLLWAGFWRQSAFVRWQGLALLVITTGKIFLWDTRALGQGYRIASFLGLGVLLMGVSFVYQRDLLRLRGREVETVAPEEPA